MKLPYMTKYNGVYYAANTEIPVEDKKIQEPVKSEVEVKTEKAPEKVATRKTVKK